MEPLSDSDISLEGPPSGHCLSPEWSSLFSVIKKNNFKVWEILDHRDIIYRSGYYFASRKSYNEFKR